MNAKGPSDSVDRRFLDFFKTKKKVDTRLVKDNSDELEEALNDQSKIAKTNASKKNTNKRTNGLKKLTNQKLPDNEVSELEAEFESICSPKNGVER